MFSIDETVIEDDIAVELFACDLIKCKGACCTLKGGRGAPVLECELGDLYQAVPIVKKYLSRKHLQVLEMFGAVEGDNGNYTTVCIDDNECVFVYYDESVAWCAFERAFFQKEISWRKPLSCHLFPIRISSKYGDNLRYERISECLSAVENGKKSNILLYEFVKDALIRKYGEQWYNEFLNECKSRDLLLQHKL